MTSSHWLTWHDAYDDPASPLSARLAVVQSHLTEALDRAGPGPLHILSVCAGQGRDIVGAVSVHHRRPDVTARLVEADPANAAYARRAVEAAGLERFDVVEGDAAVTRAYEGVVPAAVVVMCGVFGNIEDTDIEGTIAHLPELCDPRATVLWTRHRRPPDRTAAIRTWFDRAGFDEVRFDAPEGFVFTVGSHVLRTEPKPFDPDVTLFNFVGDGALPA
jgi:hypothetical protein